MPAETVFESEYVTVWCYPEAKIIHHKFHKFLFGQVLRDALDAGTEAMRKHGATKWLSDDRANSVLPQADMEWGQTDWFPRTLAAGWKYWAIVLPENVLGQMNMKRLAKDYSSRGLTVEFFTDPDQARAWLDKQ